MQFTGSQLISKRNFYTQNSNFGANIGFSVDSPSTRYEFGFTGQNKVSIVLESGKMFYNDLFIHNYEPNLEYDVSLGITNTNVNISKNNTELIWGGGKETGNYDYFFFSRANTGANANFDFSISGSNLPIYSIDKIGYYIYSGQDGVTGEFNNINGFDIKIFESTAYSTQALSFSGISGFISNGQDKKFAYIGDLSAFDYTQPIFTIFNTNLGNLNINFRIINATNLSRFVLLNDIEDFSFNSNDQINRTLSYTNYSGGIGGSVFPTDLLFKLSYVSGSGNFTVNDFAEEAYFTAIAIGNFLESGRVTGVSNTITGNENVSGVYTIYFDRFQWATGAATGSFGAFGTGLSSGIGYTGAAYGYFTGSATGLIKDGSGSLSFNNVLLNGISSGGSYSINYNDYINSTGYLNISGIYKNDVIYIGVESTPIMKGLQFNDLTGLNYYLNNNSQHKVKSIIDNDVIYLEAAYSGTEGDGIFVRYEPCNFGNLYSYSPFLTGGQNIGSTGNIVYGVSQFVGLVNTKITGSGNYRLPVTDVAPGLFSFTRTFTGSWDLLTGLAGQPLVLVNKYNTLISGRGNFQPNSNMVFQINHYDSEFNQDGVNFTISGNDVINPIIKEISQ